MVTTPLSAYYYFYFILTRTDGCSWEEFTANASHSKYNLVYFVKKQTNNMLAWCHSQFKAFAVVPIEDA